MILITVLKKWRHVPRDHWDHAQRACGTWRLVSNVSREPISNGTAYLYQYSGVKLSSVNSIKENLLEWLIGCHPAYSIMVTYDWNVQE